MSDLQSGQAQPKKKKIILCSDGTGNKGGHGASTNVFRIYNAIDIQDPNNPQITFYDDGVGTHENKYIRGLTGAFGIGFKRNVRDLYEFLARNYNPGDDIYLFGFSRGAATVRAFAGMIQECGLLDTRKRAFWPNGQFSEAQFQIELANAMRAYVKNTKAPHLKDQFKKDLAVHHPTHALDGNLKIKMIGVWDTVSALGFPRDSSLVVKWVFDGAELVSNWFWPHSFYNYQLNGNVEWVHHALAIDDERKTFHPKVWNETDDSRPQNIEQVWFAGAHSDVGGGYPRSELASVSLDWMMERAGKHDIKFKKGVHDEVRAAANAHGKLHNSRDGVAIYYRYAPRDIEALCLKKFRLNAYAKQVFQYKKLNVEGAQTSRLRGRINIHDSVFERMERPSNRYAPGLLPKEFYIVSTPSETGPIPISWSPNRFKISGLVATRETLYRLLVEVTLVLIFMAVWFWNYPTMPDFPDGEVSGFQRVAEHLADILNYFLPKLFGPLISFAMISHPGVSLLALAIPVMLHLIQKGALAAMQDACEQSCRSLLQAIQTHKSSGQP